MSRKGRNTVSAKLHPWHGNTQYRMISLVLCFSQRTDGLVSHIRGCWWGSALERSTPKTSVRKPMRLMSKDSKYCRKLGFLFQRACLQSHLLWGPAKKEVWKMPPLWKGTHLLLESHLWRVSWKSPWRDGDAGGCPYCSLHLPCLAGTWAWRRHPSTALLRQAGLSGQGTIPLPAVLLHSLAGAGKWEWLPGSPIPQADVCTTGKALSCCIAESCGCTVEIFSCRQLFHLSFLLLF